MKLEEFFNIWLNKYVSNRVKLRTYNKYNLNLIKYVYPFLGDLEIDKVTKEDMINHINELINDKNNPLSKNTIIGVIQNLKQGFNLAFDLGYVITNPVKGIKLPKVREKEVTALTRKEQKIIEEYYLMK